MWLLFGIIAVIMAVLNLVRTVRGQDPERFRYISLSFTALTLCSLYSQTARWVAREDWAALMDVVPAMSRWVWICAIASILINGISLFNPPSR